MVAAARLARCVKQVTENMHLYKRNFLWNNFLANFDNTPCKFSLPVSLYFASRLLHQTIMLIDKHTVLQFVISALIDK